LKLLFSLSFARETFVPLGSDTLHSGNAHCTNKDWRDVMQKRYLVLSTWIDKQTGAPKSSIGEINEGVNKEGKPYQITNTDNTVVFDGKFQVGTVLGGTISLTPEGAEKGSVQNQKISDKL